MSFPSLPLSSHDGFHRRANMSAARYAASSVNKTTCTLVLLFRSEVRKKRRVEPLSHRNSQKKAHVFPRKRGQLSLSHKTQKSNSQSPDYGKHKKMSPLSRTLCWRQQKNPLIFFHRGRDGKLYFSSYFLGERRTTKEKKRLHFLGPVNLSRSSPPLPGKKSRSHSLCFPS